MTDFIDYEALVRTIAVRDIVSDENNRRILSDVRDEDYETDELTVVVAGHQVRKRCDYWPAGRSDAGWLGYFVGQSTRLRELKVLGIFDLDDMEPFFRGLQRNESIKNVKFEQTNVLSGGALSPSINAFMKNNPSLVDIEVAGCAVGAEGWRLLSLALGSFTGLKHFELDDNGDISEEELVNIITALSMHPSLRSLSFMQMNVGHNACTAIATLCKNTATELRRLSLWGSPIDDERVETLLGEGGLSGSNALDDLVLSDIYPITSRSYRALASILERPQTRLSELGLTYVDVDDDGAIILARALRNNRTLRGVAMTSDQMTTNRGWLAFSRALCDTSSPNSTFHSNHTLQYCYCPLEGVLPDDVRRFLELNRNDEKSEVAIDKILMSHSQLDMEPLFEWDMKVLPIAIDWFERADAIGRDFEANLDQKKLSSTYQFIRGMPTVWISGQRRHRLNEVKARKAELEAELSKLRQEEQDLMRYVQLKDNVERGD